MIDGTESCSVTALNKFWEYDLPIYFPIFYRPHATKLDIAVEVGTRCESYKFIVFMDQGQENICESEIICRYEILETDLSWDYHIMRACQQAHEELEETKRDIEEQLRGRE